MSKIADHSARQRKIEIASTFDLSIMDKQLAQLLEHRRLIAESILNANLDDDIFRAANNEFDNVSIKIKLYLGL